MNEILQLKGKLGQIKSGNTPGPSNIPKNKYVSIDHLEKLKDNLQKIKKFWEEEKLNIKPLVSAYYISVVAKSNRLKGILESNLKQNNNAIVGAKFTEGNYKKHIITYCVSIEIIDLSIKNIENVIKIISNNFGDKISHHDIEKINHKEYEKLFIKGVSRTRFVNIVVDAYYLESFGIEQDTSHLVENSIITIYDTGTKTSDIMNQLGINFLEVRSIDETTLLLTPDQYSLLKSKAPYLISMAVSDISKIDKGVIFDRDVIDANIPSPNNEPIIGVIDTMFDDRVYFSEWVEFENKVDDNIELKNEDYEHGTMVTSIIVDGPSLNPELDDGCGRFKVRHFGVAKSGKFSSFSVLRSIKEIVETNRDIKVWNLSLGSSMEINSNFISPEAAILDRIQYENDIIFIVAGTNKPKNSKIKKIGAPADSINSIVVNSVSFDKEPADYSREGLVLSFFNKPDISYYGGDDTKYIKTCSPLGEAFVSGTSFAAPWIARKMSYLIDILGLTRELAKALIIDSATGWADRPYNPQLVGYGIVPIKIEDIISTPEDEIKFMINGVSEEYETYNYNIPIPEKDGKQPFVSKATLCYFPSCSRNQGVDYTNTEMDIHFGRLSKTNNGKVKINCINDNKQSDEGKVLLYEGEARKLYRKWDNVKHIRENIKTPRGRQKLPKKKNDNELWGISIKTKERLNASNGNDLKFGVVITLKEVNGVNRIQEFIQQCQFRGWLINTIDIESRIDIYNTAEEEIEFE
ncbi:S8 family peptidase [Urinicoccus massiliensis]|uniref:S8 family peptidase n=1 Tax=Urinicoccus massiliensis TaxID=1723382 RepID=UPI000931B175|nr:S8 family peptidase [Urinicoccus massiliensis]